MVFASGKAALRGRAAATASPVVDGRFEAVLDGHVRGWAWSPSDPARRVLVRVCVDGAIVASSIAELHWPRLQSAGIGDGAHGFDVMLPASLADGGEHQVVVLADPEHVALTVARQFMTGAEDTGSFASTHFTASEELPVLGSPGLGAGIDTESDERPVGRMLVPARRTESLPASRNSAITTRLILPKWSTNLSPTSRVPVWLLLAGCVAYVLYAAYVTRHFSFFQDDYQLLVQRRAWNLDAFLAPQNQHLMITLMLFYKLMWVTVGLGTFWPYQLPVFGAHVACVIALYVLASRRAGKWVALVPAGLMLVLFPGFEDELWSLEMSITGALAAGLWALVLLDRGGRRRDAWACILIALSIASQSAGLFLVAGVAIGLAITNWRRLWVAGIPLLLYAAWYAHYGQSDIVWSNLPSVPGYDLHIAGYGFAGLLGLSSSSFGSDALIAGYPLLAAAALWVVYKAARRQLSAIALVGVLAAVGFWIGTALARAGYGQPDASRYLYVSGALILLVVAASARPWKARLYGSMLAAAAGVAIIAVGLTPLQRYASGRTTYDALTRVQLAAVQLAGPAANPEYIVDRHLMGGIEAGDWLGVVHDLGSNAYSPSKITQLPTWYQQSADQELIGAESIMARPSAAIHSGCVRMGSSGSLVDRTVAPGTVLHVTNTSRTAVGISLRRIAQAFPSRPQLRLPAGSSGAIRFPRDAYAASWRVRLAPTPGGRAAADAHGGVCVSSSSAAAA